MHLTATWPTTINLRWHDSRVKKGLDEQKHRADGMGVGGGAAALCNLRDTLILPQATEGTTGEAADRNCLPYFAGSRPTSGKTKTLAMHPARVGERRARAPCGLSAEGRFAL